jgi:hypothetical protein
VSCGSLSGCAAAGGARPQRPRERRPQHPQATARMASVISMAGQVAYMPVATAGKIYQGVSAAADLNEATLSGAIDIVVVRRADGVMRSTPFHVRFGKFQVLRPSNKLVHLRVNDREVDLKMTLGKSGEAYFVNEADVSTSTSVLMRRDLADGPCTCLKPARIPTALSPRVTESNAWLRWRPTSRATLRSPP